ncbi:MAG: hypothetical protein GF370_00920 [Candidatus Nealsonbacteria bacterium]|nr:hypothetical protein [Candidatus Nealsonbacteria bacterium]
MIKIQSKKEIIEELKKDLTVFFKKKKILERINKFMILFEQEEMGEREEEETPKEAVGLMDALNDIKKIIDF